MEQLNKAEKKYFDAAIKSRMLEVRANVMMQILEENQDETLSDSMNEQIISKKFLEAYTIKDALEVIEVLLTNKNK